MELPEDILKEKWSGNFDRAKKLIAQRLSEDIPRALRCRLDLELKNLEDLENCYTVTREEALQKLMPRTHNGAVILLHSTSKTNAQILQELITKWKEEGYQFKSLEKLSK